MYDNPLQKLKDRYSREIIFSKQELQCLTRVLSEAATLA
jgi:hypothetical protein